MQQIIVPIILGIVALVILFQLYNVLGKRAGFRVEDKPLVAKPDDNGSQTGLLEKPGDAARSPNLELLKTRDINFNEINFLEKARETYEQVVLAFHKGELDTVREKLSDHVFEAFRSAIAGRTAANTDTLSFVGTPKADIDLVDFNDDTAQVRVRFLSELAYEAPAVVLEAPAEPVGDDATAAPDKSQKKDEPKPVVQHKRTAEFWTFQKTLRAQNNPWLLSRVEAAKA